MNLNTSPNINHLWASLMIEELVRNGVRYFCISPGSRSSPLVLAVAANKKADSFIHFDERANAFHALGYASAAKKPCAIITTSGTAVANLFPAVIESSKKKIPLIVLTADRPPELRFTGAHQTIDQVKIFGEYVRWQFDLPCPTKDIQPEFVLTTMDQAVARAQGNLQGPVHINCMYREPLAPVKSQTKFNSYIAPIRQWQKDRLPYTQYRRSEAGLNQPEINQALSSIKKIKGGIIVVGKISGEKERQSVLNLAKKLNWPVFPDISSGLRCGNVHQNIIHYFDQILLARKWMSKFKLDGVIHLGGRITSKRWYDFIERNRPQQYIMVLNHPLRNDPLHNVTIRIQSSIASFCEAVQKKTPQRKNGGLLLALQTTNQKIERTMAQYFNRQEKLSEPAVARLITQNIPKNDCLFLASSLPVRETDMYAAIDGPCIEIGSNRGASGIDGTLATAAGFSTGHKKKVTLLIGDLACLHDLNALAMQRELMKPMVIVVFNNNGGGIFSFMPIAQYRKGFERYFGTPHGLEFSSAARMFGLNYSKPDSVQGFVGDYHNALKSKKSTIIEVESNRSQNHQLQQKLQGKIRNCVK
jgi:2-succinyl-5-enolpyruvyl-6-hydroxy-3-cyclohexene-1-carboxylate synthase